MSHPHPDAAANERTTPFYSCHLAAGARMVDFAGWQMPVAYSSQIEEHHAVRQSAGMFDVSHMCSLDLYGADSTKFLRHLLANDVARLQQDGKALYSCMLNENGGVIDDLIVYRLAEKHYRLVVNAATADSDIQWMRGQIIQQACNLTLTARRDLALLAVQGPQAIERATAALPVISSLVENGRALPAPFFALDAGGDWLLARTGYSGEDGLEISLPAAQAQACWQALLAAGVVPCGLGARDTLRLEAGMNLYGQDMDAQTSPLDAGLGWTVDLRDESRRFVGRDALEAHPEPRAFLGLVLDGRGVLRAGMAVRNAAGDSGILTSGTFSPSLQKAIALARLPVGSQPGEAFEVNIRDKWLPAHSVKPPFVRAGKILI